MVNAHGNFTWNDDTTSCGSGLPDSVVPKESRPIPGGVGPADRNGSVYQQLGAGRERRVGCSASGLDLRGGHRGAGDYQNGNSDNTLGHRAPVLDPNPGHQGVTSKASASGHAIRSGPRDPHLNSL